MADRGLDLSDHRSRQLVAEMLGRADLVIGMAREHVREAAVLNRDVLATHVHAQGAGARGRATSGPAPADEPSPPGWRASPAVVSRTRCSGSATTTSSTSRTRSAAAGADYETTADVLDDLLGRVVALAFPVEEPTPQERTRVKVAIGADHAGFDLKAHLVAELRAPGPRGRSTSAPTAPSRSTTRRSARPSAAPWWPGEAERGIVLGGSGQGEQIAANKVHGVRAALCNDLYTARFSREHNDANVLAMGGRIVATGLAVGDPRARGSPRPSRAAATSAASPRSPTSRTRRA